jgi:hypothetical protein
MEIATSAFAGLVVGYVLAYILLYRPLLKLYHSMRLQGFVPQFELQQRKVHDPSANIRER